MTPIYSEIIPKILFLSSLYLGWGLLFASFYGYKKRIFYGFASGLILTISYWAIQKLVVGSVLFVYIYFTRTFLEESIKLLPVVILSRHDSRVKELIFYGFFVACGFSYGETLLLYLGDYDLLLLRTIFNASSHILYTYISVYGFTRYLETDNWYYNYAIFLSAYVHHMINFIGNV